ncbi:response regulator [Dyella acidiphila]|uniref:Response regulator n=1 Tax=Dyella acidiphila TaxID=2775866 RepID=A0ABR9G6J3_9GAMM|nr:response regulator [Dyella acidiphila]MBE1159650.1 response regulator [Dyella acidiphila]
MSRSVAAIVLIAEDSEPVRELAREALEDEGYHVIDFSDGIKALALLKGEQVVDLLFTDVMMPGGMDGIELAVRARKFRHGLKVLVTSGQPYVDTSAIEGAIYLPKPYRLTEMLQAVRRTIAQ